MYFLVYIDVSLQANNRGPYSLGELPYKSDGDACHLAYGV